MLPALLLVAALAILAWTMRRGRPRRSGGRPMDERAFRRAQYLRWACGAALAFLLPSLVGLALLGRLPALVVTPPEFAAAAALIGPLGLSDTALFGAGLGGGVLGALAGTIWSRRRGRRGVAGPMLGDVGALLPRHRAELPLATMLAITAGVTEEPFFRLLLPLLITQVTGSAMAGFGVAALLFGAAHRYQGWKGVAATTFMALLFSALYLASGRLWVGIAFHVMVDVLGLVVRPALTGAWQRRPSS
jgi:membrane protease YdiL (CAAX protease family)